MGDKASEYVVTFCVGSELETGRVEICRLVTDSCRFHVSVYQAAWAGKEILQRGSVSMWTLCYYF